MVPSNKTRSIHHRYDKLNILVAWYNIGVSPARWRWRYGSLPLRYASLALADDIQYLRALVHLIIDTQYSKASLLKQLSKGILFTPDTPKISPFQFLQFIQTEIQCKLDLESLVWVKITKYVLPLYSPWCMPHRISLDHVIMKWHCRMFTFIACWCPFCPCRVRGAVSKHTAPLA